MRTGDLIRLDVENRRIDLVVDDVELRSRAGERTAPVHPDWDASRGYAKLFLDSVLQADEGCDFNFLVRNPSRKEKNAAP